MGLVSVGLRKPSSVPRKTAKRPQYQRLADVPVNVFEICMSEINQTGPVSIFLSFVILHYTEDIYENPCKFFL